MHDQIKIRGVIREGGVGTSIQGEMQQLWYLWYFTKEK